MEELYYVNKDLVRGVLEKKFKEFVGLPFDKVTITELFFNIINTINLLPTIPKSQLFNTAELVWWEEWSPSTPDAPRECIGGGWQCSNCGSDLGDYMTEHGGEHCYFDRFEEKPTIAFCPCCGRKFNK